MRQFHVFFFTSLVLIFTPFLGAASPLDDAKYAYAHGYYDVAFQKFQSLAANGDANAEANLGYMYISGQGVRQDYAEALKWIQKAVDQNNAFAQRQLGYLYEMGQGVRQDFAEAVRWYRKSAEQGDAVGQANLGNMYRSGHGVSQDYAEALKWIQKSTAQNNAVGQRQLGYLYERGQGVQQDYVEAVKWYRKSAEQGDAVGQVNLGTMYANGNGVPRDYAEALKWFQKAADQNNAFGQANLGFSYQKGHGVKQDEKEALRLYILSAAQGALPDWVKPNLSQLETKYPALAAQYRSSQPLQVDTASNPQLPLPIISKKSDVLPAGQDKIAKMDSTNIPLSQKDQTRTDPVKIGSTGTGAGKRVALVIGNDKYQSVAPLKNADRDASTIASALREVGFDKVTLLTDLTGSELLRALKFFSDEADSADWAVIYYSGHGLEMSGTNYLIPVDAKLKRDRDVELEAVSLDKFLSVTESAKKLRVVILDACRNNPFAQQMSLTTASRSIGRGLAQIEPEAGTLVVYSAKHGQVALDGDEGGNSPFATALIKNIKKPGVDVRRIFDLVRDDVVDATGRQQTPFSYGSLSGREDFYFVPSTQQ